MSTSQLLQYLYSINTSSPDFSHLRCGLIRQDEDAKYLSGPSGSDLALLVNFFDDVCSLLWPLVL